MQIVPTDPVPNQVFTIGLGGQNCRIGIYQKATGLYLDLWVNEIAIVTGALCVNDVRLVRSTYLGFVGDLAFEDLQGLADPVSTGLGTRYVLVYVP